jgi:hypothetical protein
MQSTEEVEIEHANAQSTRIGRAEHHLHAPVRHARNDAPAAVLTFDVSLPQLRPAAPSVTAVPRTPVTARLALAVLLLLTLMLLPAAAHAAPGNGKLVYQASGSRDGFFYLRDSNGGEATSVRTANRAVAQPAFSPLGRRLAFASLGQVWVSQADGSELRQITSGAIPSGSPSWSPDGGSLVYAGGPTRLRDIYTIGADGNDLRRLTFGAGDDHTPAWSSDGRIAWVRRVPALRISKKHRRPANDDVFVMASDGTGARQVTHADANDRYPTWSPDARRIAFTRRTAGHDEVYVMRADGRGVRRLTKKADATSPTWSPDGRWIAYSGGKRPRRSIFVVRASGGRAKRVTPTASDAIAPDWQPKDPDPVIAAAGDIACDPETPEFTQGLQRQCHQLETSNELLRMDLWAVLAIGDLQYPDGVYDKILRSFAPSWGRLKSLIKPVIGNHDYRDPGASGLYDYFYGQGTDAGPAGTRGTGYYSFDIGSWHLVALDTDCSEPFSNPETAACAAGSPQEQWLKADLAAHPAACTLAFMHHPYVSSGLVTANQAVRPLWQDLYDAGADVVLVGHDHAYERFASQDPAQSPDAARGLRQFVVGTGGKSLQGPVSFLPNSIVRNSDTFGVLQMTLHARSYSWSFVPDLTSGGFTDSGTAECH